MGVAQLCRQSLVIPLLLFVPRRIGIGAPELAVLTREVLMVQVQPVVSGHPPGQDLPVIDGGVGHLGVGQRQRNRVIPRLPVGRAVDGNAGGFFQQHDVHIVLADGGINRPQLGCVHRLAGDASHLALLPDRRLCVHQKGTPPVVEQPLHLGTPPQGPESHAVGFQVVPLALVHGDQQLLRPEQVDGQQAEQDDNSARVARQHRRGGQHRGGRPGGPPSVAHRAGLHSSPGRSSR